MNAPSPIETDSNPCCEWCGLTVDQHRRVEVDDGPPEFYCVGDIVRGWEERDERDKWKWTGEPMPSWAVRNSDIHGRCAGELPKRPYDTADYDKSLIPAFWYVVNNHDADYLAAWLKRHPADAAYLMGLWEKSKNVEI